MRRLARGHSKAAARPEARARHLDERAASEPADAASWRNHDARPLWNRVVANVSVEIGFCNVLDVVRDRLSSQNVLGWRD